MGDSAEVFNLRIMGKDDGKQYDSLITDSQRLHRE